MSIDLSTLKKPEPQKQFSLFKMLNRDFQLGTKEFSLKKKEDFYSELSVLIGSGLDIKNSFSVLIEENQKAKLFFQFVYDQLVSGITLSEALKLSGRISVYEYYTIKIGEETGNLPVVLKQLTQHFNERIKRKRQIINVISYPVLILSTAILVVLFMMHFIVPMFEELFKRFQSDLPALTRTVITISNFISNNFMKIILIVLFFVLTLFYLKDTIFFRKITSEIILKVPGINLVIKKMYLAKYCQTFSLLSSSHVPIITAIQLIHKIIGFYPFEEALKQIEIDLIHGQMLHESYKSFDIFDGKIITLTKVGEEVNKLNDIYINLSQQYAEEVQHKITVLNTLVEPILIVFIGMFVALILIAMYLPLFQMSNTMF